MLLDYLTSQRLSATELIKCSWQLFKKMFFVLVSYLLAEKVCINTLAVVLNYLETASRNKTLTNIFTQRYFLLSSSAIILGIILCFLVLLPYYLIKQRLINTSISIVAAFQDCYNNLGKLIQTILALLFVGTIFFLFVWIILMPVFSLVNNPYLALIFSFIFNFFCIALIEYTTYTLMATIFDNKAGFNALSEGYFILKNSWEINTLIAIFMIVIYFAFEYLKILPFNFFIENFIKFIFIPAVYLNRKA